MENCTICGISKAQIVGIIGAVLLIIGCFVPIFSISILGKPLLSVTFLSLGFNIYGGALILTALVIIGLFFAKMVKEAQGAGNRSLSHDPCLFRGCCQWV